MAAQPQFPAVGRPGGELPQMCLHHLHLKRDGSLGPLSNVAAESALVFQDLGQEEGAHWRSRPEVDRDTCSASGCYSVALLDQEGCLVITDSSGTQELLSICVLFAQVQHGTERTTGAQLIAIEARNEDLSVPVGLWLVLVCGGGVPAARRVMAAIAASGGVRADLEAAYDLDHAPLSGAAADVYCGFERHPDDAGDSEGEEGDDFRAEVRPLRTAVAARVLTARGARGTPPQGAEPPGTLVANGTYCTLRSLPKPLAREISLLVASQGHANIVRFMGLFWMGGEGVADNLRQSEARWCVVMEQGIFGDLLALVAQGPLPEPRVRVVAKGLMDALEHIHGLGIMHRDIKAESVLVKENGRAILADFGLACLLDDAEEMRQRVGSPGYAAPEVYVGASYNERADMFSAGAALYFVVTGKLPFHGGNAAATIRRSLRSEPGFDASILRCTTSRCRDFVAQLMRKAPEERFSAKEALRTSWINGRATRRPPPNFGIQRSVHGDWEVEATDRHCQSFSQQDSSAAGSSEGVAGPFGRQFRASAREAPWPLAPQPHSQQQQQQRQNQPPHPQAQPLEADFEAVPGVGYDVAALESSSFELGRPTYQAPWSDFESGELHMGNERADRLTYRPAAAAAPLPWREWQHGPSGGSSGELADIGEPDLLFFQRSHGLPAAGAGNLPTVTAIDGSAAGFQEGHQESWVIRAEHAGAGPLPDLPREGDA